VAVDSGCASSLRSAARQQKCNHSGESRQSRRCRQAIPLVPIIDTQIYAFEGEAMKRKILFLILPVLLILSSSLVFFIITKIYGQYWGNLAGKSFYWIFWCLLVPRLITKKKIRHLFTDEKSLFRKDNWWVIILFISTIIIPIFMYNTIENLTIKPIIIIVSAIPFSIINGYCEEAFWRGFYIKEFPNSITWGIIIPSIFFSLWHFAPQLASPHTNPLAFVASTIPLGLTYALVAYRTKSAKWSAIGHTISAIFAFAGPDAASLYNIILGIR
jgi:uncharacterized protein